MWVLAKNRGTRVSTTPKIKIMDTREEEIEENENFQEEEAFMLHLFNLEMKDIKLISTLNTKEGNIGELETIK